MVGYLNLSITSSLTQAGSAIRRSLASDPVPPPSPEAVTPSAELDAPALPASPTASFYPSPRRISRENNVPRLSAPKVTYPDEGDFSRALTTAYNASKETGYIWCPVFKQYLPPVLMEFVHILPTQLDPATAGYLFGESADGEKHIHSLENGIVMARCIARLFTGGVFAIVPTQNILGHGDNETYGETEPVQLRLVLMKLWLANDQLEDLDLRYLELHNTVLSFKSTFRPDLRYLYFRYISSIIIWANIREAQEFKGLWKPKERWLRESLMVELARRMANWAVYEEVCMGNGMFDDDQDSDDEEVGSWEETPGRRSSEEGWVQVYKSRESNTKQMAMLLSKGLLEIS
ncbi:hypothetical protein ABW19_dt0204621 [Dactylella cylindrospora]|nr:hypothetical protein ABW19_dt0204621 [Dactylella cylindrospora]